MEGTGLARARLRQLRTRLGADLVRDGSATCAVGELGAVTVREWRAAAHGAGDDLRRPTTTGLTTSNVVWAVLTDWPRSVEELVAAGRRVGPRPGPEARAPHLTRLAPR